MGGGEEREGATQIGIKIETLKDITPTDLQKSLCNQDSECITGECVSEFFLQEGGLLAITNPFPSIWVNLKEFVIGDEQGRLIERTIHDSDKQGICITNLNSVGTGEELLQLGIDADEIEGTVVGDLLASACTQNSQCEDGSRCRPLSFLIDKKVLDEEDAIDIIDDTKLKLTAFGASSGALGATALCTLTLGITTGVGIPLCISAGAILGGVSASAITDIVDGFHERDVDSVGYCINIGSIEEKTGFVEGLDAFSDFVSNNLQIVAVIVGLFFLLRLFKFI